MKLKDVDKIRKFVHKIIGELEVAELTNFYDTPSENKDEEKEIFKYSEKLKKEFEKLLK